jgi:uncharacterized protein YdeI (YjbR/CyaY-like superfamily)
MNTKVDSYIKSLKSWKCEAAQLRSILLASGLDEDFKWGRPCYTFNGKNVIGITPLKDHCALNVFNGALLKDTHSILIKPGENTQSGRWIKYESVAEINTQSKILKAYIKEAIDIEKTGVKKQLAQEKVKPVENKIPIEFQNILNNNKALNAAFKALTPGRQRAYLLFFSAPKQSQTIITRVEKYIPKILCGKGINDCTCGHSKRMPACDGSHKNY